MPLDATAYDIVPYPSHVYPETHPDRLAAAGTLFGVDPPPIERSRVLDIGCGDAGNLVAMAVGLPGSQFTGIDLAGEPIKVAQAIINQLGLQNIRVRQMDLLDIDSEFGQFDYIIAHGFYSWVPPEVQEKLLEVCQKHLSPQGIAFISYNVYPAGRLREASRDLMRFHLDRIGPSTERVRDGKIFLKFAVDSIEGNGIWKNVLEHEFARLSKRDDSATFHDELGPIYSPVLFSTFMESANRSGLQFVSEASIRDTLNPPAKPEVLTSLKEFSGGDLIAFQQYLDFLLFRGFRRTLLCHSQLKLEREDPARGIGKLWIASPLMTSGRGRGGEIQFANQRGPGTLKTNNKLVIALLQHLEKKWPRAERFDDLLSTKTLQLSEPLSKTRDDLTNQLLTLAVNGLIELRTYSASFTENTGDRPVASPLARMQARESSMISTLLHTNIEMKDLQARRFLQLLDGTRDERALSESLAIDCPNISARELEAQVRGTLAGFYQTGLLLG